MFFIHWPQRSSIGMMEIKHQIVDTSSFPVQAVHMHSETCPAPKTKSLLAYMTLQNSNKMLVQKIDTQY